MGGIRSCLKPWIVLTDGRRTKVAARFPGAYPPTPSSLSSHRLWQKAEDFPEDVLECLSDWFTRSSKTRCSTASGHAVCMGSSPFEPHLSRCHCAFVLILTRRYTLRFADKNRELTRDEVYNELIGCADDKDLNRVCAAVCWCREP